MGWQEQTPGVPGLLRSARWHRSGKAFRHGHDKRPAAAAAAGVAGRGAGGCLPRSSCSLTASRSMGPRANFRQRAALSKLYLATTLPLLRSHTHVLQAHAQRLSSRRCAGRGGAARARAASERAQQPHASAGSWRRPAAETHVPSWCELANRLPVAFHAVHMPTSLASAGPGVVVGGWWWGGGGGAGRGGALPGSGGATANGRRLK